MFPVLAQATRLRPSDRAGQRDHLVKVHAANVLHLDEILRSGVADAAGLHDVRMVEHHAGTRLEFETRHHAGIELVCIGENLEGDLRAGFAIDGNVDESHAPHAEHFQQLVTVDEEPAVTSVEKPFRLKAGQQTVGNQRTGKFARLGRVVRLPFSQRSEVLGRKQFALPKQREEILNDGGFVHQKLTQNGTGIRRRA